VHVGKSLQFLKDYIVEMSHEFAGDERESERGEREKKAITNLQEKIG
jgi:hypothetical protein